MVVIGQKRFYSGKLIDSGNCGCNRAKAVVFGQKWLCLGKMVVFGKKWLYSGKVVVFEQK